MAEKAASRKRLYNAEWREKKHMNLHNSIPYLGYSQMTAP